MPKTARDVMQTHVITVGPNDPLYSVQRLFYEEGIHGAPVIDEAGALQGILTSTDILRAAVEDREVEAAEPAERATFEEDLDFSHTVWGMAPKDFRSRLRDTIVADYMTDRVVAVRPETPVSGIARTLRENQVHRVLVIEDDKLRGIVSAFDLIALLEET